MFLQDERGRRGWALLNGALMREFLARPRDQDADDFIDQKGELFVHVPDRLQLIDLSDEPVLQEFLSGQFDARHFNAVDRARDNFTVVKRSNDRVKLKREFDFYYLLPPIMQTYLIQPFDFQDDGVFASYPMEKVGVPNVAVQWVHGGLQPHEFKRLLEHVFHFISIRPERPAPKSKYLATAQALYVDKVRDRIAALKGFPQYQKLQPLFDSTCGGLMS